MSMGEIRYNVTVDTADATAKLEEFKGRVDDTEESAEGTGRAFTRLGTGIGIMASRAFIAYDRFAIATEAVTNAQTRQMLAQDRLQSAIERYGVGSDQARRAQQELEISTSGVEIAQRRLHVRMIFGIGVMIPGMIRSLQGLITAAKGLDAANISNVLTTNALTASRLALIAVSTLGVGLLVGGLALGGAFSMAQQLPQPPNVNVYGDVNLQGRGMGPAAFGQASADWARTTRP